MPDDTKAISSEYVPNDAETYDEWFTRQVEIGLREADDPNTVWYSQEEVFSSLEKRRNEWRARVEKQREVA